MKLSITSIVLPVIILLTILLSGAAHAAQGYLKTSYVDGFDRVCIYNVLGSRRELYIGATQLCPITHNF
ncbi:hypothetical protein [Vibrio sp. FJH11]